MKRKNYFRPSDVKKRNISVIIYTVGTLSAHQQNAILMAFCLRANDVLLLDVLWENQMLHAIRNKKRIQETKILIFGKSSKSTFKI